MNAKQDVSLRYWPKKEEGPAERSTTIYEMEWSLDEIPDRVGILRDRNNAGHGDFRPFQFVNLCSHLPQEHGDFRTRVFTQLNRQSLLSISRQVEFLRFHNAPNPDRGEIDLP